MNDQSTFQKMNSQNGTAEVSIVGLLERIEQRLARLEGAVAQLDSVARTAPGAIATVTDTLDSVAARLAESGVDVDERMRTSLRLLERLTAPQAANASETLLNSSMVDERAVGALGKVADALAAEADHEPAAVGPWGALRALGDRDVQHALGFLLAIAKRLGASIAEPPRAQATSELHLHDEALKGFTMPSHHSVLIIGGGTGGISVAARLRLAANPPDVAIIEPSEQHFYQPIWTLVGAGVFAKETSLRAEADYIPEGVTWIRDAVAEFDPKNNAVITTRGERVTYDQLVVAAGIQLDWGKIKGLEGNLGKNGICSNYRYDLVDSTWRTLKAFKGGNAIFTFPSTPVKCAGAPQKIMYLADDALRKAGVREKSKVLFASAAPTIFGVKKYARALTKVIERKDITMHFRHDLVEVRAASKEAVFKALDGGPDLVLNYQMLHVVPPRSAPDFVKQSELADKAGWVEVDKFNLQHARFPNVFSLGDCSSLPCSRTGAAIRKQAPVLVENLLAHRAGKRLVGLVRRLRVVSAGHGVREADPGGVRL